VFETPSGNTTLAFGLIVGNNTAQDRDVVRLTVVESFPEENLPPVADAGENMTVRGGDLVDLDATKSIDPNGGNLSFAWTQTGGMDRANVTLSNADTFRSLYLSPDDVLNNTMLVFTVNVTDPGGLSSTDSVSFLILTDVVEQKAILPLYALVAIGAAGAGGAAAAVVIIWMLRRKPVEDIYVP